MGLEKNKEMEKRGSSKKRGSVNNQSRLDAFTKKGVTAGADWGGCAADKLQTVVTMITEMGGAVTIGLSRDGGAHMLTLLLDEKRKTLWFNGDADLDEELDSVIQTLESTR